MSGVMIVAVVLNLLVLGAFIWLVVVAFKHRVLWGLMVLVLSPIGAILFGIKHWAVAKRPFCAYFTGLGFSLAFAGYLFAAFGGPQVIAMARDVEQGQLNEAEALAFIEQSMSRTQGSGASDAEGGTELGGRHEMLADDERGQESVHSERLEAGPAPSHASVPVPSTAPSTVAKVRYAYRDVDLSELLPYVSYRVKVGIRDGREHQAVLLGVDQDRVTLRRAVSGGKFDFGVPTSEVVRVQVLAPES